MTCAKRRVRCILIDAEGRTAAGENWCATPVDFCPRDAGEGYEKCRTVCNQVGHAEAVALANWRTKYGLGHQPSAAVLVGHERVCDSCGNVLSGAGVRHTVVMP